MWTIRCSDVPSFLRESSFFQSLDLEDQEVFVVPEDCFKPDLAIDCDIDLSSVLKTVQYWGLPEVPIEVVSYMLRIGDVADYTGLLVDFPYLAPYLNKVLQVKRVRYCDGIRTAIHHGLGAHIVRMLCELDYVLSGDGCEVAAAVGDLESLMYLHTEGCPWDERTTTAAVVNNHLDCLEYAIDFNCPKVADLIDIAAQKGTVEAIQFLHNCGIVWTENTVFAAIKGGNLASVRFLIDSSCEMPADPCSLAAQFGQLDILQYLHEDGHPLTRLCTVAAANGHLPCLTYLHQQHCPWDARCCCAAAAGNHLDCLMYLHVNGCAWDDTTMAAALATKSWDCLGYARHHGCSAKCLYYLGTQSLMLPCLFILLAYVYLKDRSTEKWYDSYGFVVSGMLMPIFPVINELNNKFIRYHTHYISIDTGNNIVHGYFLVAATFNVLFYLYYFFCVYKANETVV